MAKVKETTLEDKKKVEAFDKASDSFKSLFDKNGVNMDALSKLINQCLRLCNDDLKLMHIHNLIFDLVNNENLNYFESVGMLDVVKSDYIHAYMDVMSEENDED